MDGSFRGDDAEKIEAILSSYRDATGGLLDALRSGDGDAVARGVEARESCIDAYAAAVEVRNRRGTPTADGALRDRVLWHHLRIEELEIEIHRLLKESQGEVERDLGRIRKGRKTRDAYAALPFETSRIINGEG